MEGTPITGRFFGQSSFATHTNVAERLAVKVPAELPLHVLGPLGCGVMTGAGAVFNTLAPKPGSSFAVFGTGAVGFSGLLAAKVVGCTTIIAVDVVHSKLQKALQLGATHIINSAEQDPQEAIREITGGKGVDYALDAVGISAVFTQMANSLAVRGHGVLVGAPKPGDDARLDVGTLLNASSPRLSLVLEGDAAPQEFIPRLIRLYQAGLFPVDELVTSYKFEDINTAISDSERGTAIKPVVTF
jgi:aryl-alcohol dehydrogenase